VGMSQLSNCVMLISAILNSPCPSNLGDTVSTVAPHTSCLRLHSAKSANYMLPWLRTNFGEQAFSHAGPAAWNSFPHELLKLQLDLSRLTFWRSLFFDSVALTFAYGHARIENRAFSY